jgi:hypothetical protein
MNSKGLYEIEKISDGLVLIFGTTYISPISYLSDIDEALRILEFNGRVVFDLLLSNGHSSNRFIEAYTDGCKIHRSSMKVVGESRLDESILNRIQCFYRSHSYLLEANQILFDEEKNRLIHSR